MNKPAVSQAQMRRAKKAMEAEGVPFGGYRCYPDGRVDVLPANGNESAPIDPLDAELADWDRRHGYD